MGMSLVKIDAWAVTSNPRTQSESQNAIKVTCLPAAFHRVNLHLLVIFAIIRIRPETLIVASRRLGGTGAGRPVCATLFAPICAGISMSSQPTSAPSTRLLRAAQYLRMSTEHQQYSIANQSAAIALYAAAHNIGIVRSFADEGKSGTTIKRRTGLQELLRTVESGAADFATILVYDVSRWGRFPDADEAAHYEFLCKKAGILVRYCAEQFENDNSTTSNLLKALKRTMAGEYSRELSVKVLAGQRRLVEKGFHMGDAPYGLRRQLLDTSGNRRQTLGTGERKNIQTDRVILIPGPTHEVNVVREIFNLFTEEGKTRTQIFRILNQRNHTGRKWNLCNVSYTLENPAYMGTNAFGRCDPKTGRKRRPREEWAVCEGAFQPIVPPKQFARAQEIIQERRRKFTDDKMLEVLRRLWVRKGTLNSDLIDGADDVPSTSAYYHHFGGITQAYRIIGFHPKRDSSYTIAGHSFSKLKRELLDDLACRIRSQGGTATLQPFPPGSMVINEGITLRIMVSRPRTGPQGNAVWAVNLNQQTTVDILIVARIDPGFRSVFDYYVIPRLAELHGIFHIRARGNAAFVDLYRMDSLQAVIDCLTRTSVPMPA
jgi:DNA invertase Pin-like site-specific DNA recombinase